MTETDEEEEEEEKSEHRPLVDHTYQDFSRYIQQGGRLPRHKKSFSNFPAKLHIVLTDPYNAEAITWMPHGRAWKILNKELFMSSVVSTHFGQTKFESFTRQLNGWGFKRLHQPGADYGCYYNQFFLRGLPKLTSLMRRTPPNQGPKRPHIEGEPNFYAISNRYPLPPPPAPAPPAQLLPSAPLPAARMSSTQLLQPPQSAPITAQLSAPVTSQLGNPLAALLAAASAASHASPAPLPPIPAASQQTNWGNLQNIQSQLMQPSQAGAAVPYLAQLMASTQNAMSTQSTGSSSVQNTQSMGSISIQNALQSSMGSISTQNAMSTQPMGFITAQNATQSMDSISAQPSTMPSAQGYAAGYLAALAQLTAPTAVLPTAQQLRAAIELPPPQALTQQPSMGNTQDNLIAIAPSSRGTSNPASTNTSSTNTSSSGGTSEMIQAPAPTAQESFFRSMSSLTNSAATNGQGLLLNQAQIASLVQPQPNQLGPNFLNAVQQLTQHHGNQQVVQRKESSEESHESAKNSADPDSFTNDFNSLLGRLAAGNTSSGSGNIGSLSGSGGNGSSGDNGNGSSGGSDGDDGNGSSGSGGEEGATKSGSSEAATKSGSS